MYLFNGILLNFKKEGNSGTCCNVDKPLSINNEDIMFSETSQSQKDKCCMIPFI